MHGNEKKKKRLSSDQLMRKGNKYLGQSRSGSKVKIREKFLKKLKKVVIQRKIKEKFFFKT